jgi:methionine-rich copper-binding protein CopC
LYQSDTDRSEKANRSSCREYRAEKRVMTAFSKLGIALLTALMLGMASVADATIDPRSPNNIPADTVAANLVLVFSDVIDLQASLVEIRDEHDRLIDTGKLRFGENGIDVEIPLNAPLLPGTYTMEWRAIPADGRESIGGYTFTIDPIATAIPAVAQQGH